MILSCSKEETVPVPEFVDIPDMNFLSLLIDAGVDYNGDGKISYTEAMRVTQLKIACWGSRNIYDLKGLEAFINLRKLECFLTSAHKIDVSKMKDLEYLSCVFNHLRYLDLQENTKLEYLKLYPVWFWKLDLTNNVELTEINISAVREWGLKVCVWEEPFPPEGVKVKVDSTVFFTLDCSLPKVSPEYFYHPGYLGPD